MTLNKTLTATVYIVYQNKVLLHMHKKHQSLFPIGGHLESHELPHEAAYREAVEEAGLEVTLYNNQDSLGMTRVRQLPHPQYTLLENIGYPVENLDFIYFATAMTFEVNPQAGESRELYWLDVHEVQSHPRIKEHIRLMALKALEVMRES